MSSVGLPRLSASTLSGITGARLPAYDRRSAAPGIVHLGLGAFARGHIARYCDDLLALGEPVAITGASLRSGSSTHPLADQDGLYTLIEADGTNAHLRVIGSVTALTNGAAAAVDAIATSSTTAVTLTITEKGYHRSAGGGINHDDPAVAHDLAHPDSPLTAPGVLVAALKRRRDNGLDGLAVVSCDNLSANGSVSAGVLEDLATALDPDLAAWIVEHVSFPSTVVDRIVPAKTDIDLRLVADRLGLRDDAPVRAEPHCSWVIENAPGLPRWDLAGAQLVDDIVPWEQRKLRTLNGPHSALAYLGALAGHVMIDKAANDPDLSRFVEALLVEEVAPTLDALNMGITSGAEEGPSIARDTLHRFRNPLGHRCEQVAADGSQKLPQRIGEVITARRAADKAVDRSALVIAAWIAWILRCSRGEGRLVDPLAAELLEIAERADPNPAALAAAFLGIDAVFEPDIGTDPVVVGAVARGLSLIGELGASGAARELTK